MFLSPFFDIITKQPEEDAYTNNAITFNWMITCRCVILQPYIVPSGVLIANIFHFLLGWLIKTRVHLSGKHSASHDAISVDDYSYTQLRCVYHCTRSYSSVNWSNAELTNLPKHYNGSAQNISIDEPTRYSLGFSAP